MDGGREKKFAVENIERNSEPIALLCDNIFYFAELGMQEAKQVDAYRNAVDSQINSLTNQVAVGNSKIQELQRAVQAQAQGQAATR